MTATVLASPIVKPRKSVPTCYETDESKYAGPHHWQIQWWARIVRRLWRQRAYTQWLTQACSQIEIFGEEHLATIDGPCVFIANHQSHIDTLLAHAALPEAVRSRLYFGAAQDRWFVKGKKKLTLKPWYQSLALGNFPILRGGGADALAYAHWLLRHGQHVFLFPEGTRATSDELGVFKHGATLLALENDVPIVPLYLAGLREIRPKGSRDVRRGLASVEFLSPLRFAPNSDVAAATAVIRERMQSVHRRYQQAIAPVEKAA
jgi:1-acyl-sn-glycerol-3-phosphate acyltransferase